MEDASALRERMVQRLEAGGVISSPAVGRAMRAVPRHRFAPKVDLVDAYADHAVVVGRAPDGTPISTASQPTMVAIMLEELGLVPGQRVLEIGTGSGYNAALLAELVGDTGHVTSVELEPALADRAAETLTGTGHGGVEVVVGDGRLGHPPRAPFDRVIVTTGAQEIAPAWREQLIDGGRLVSPIVDRDGRGTVVSHDKVGGELIAGRRVPCGFLPLRQAPADESPRAG